jgi:ribosomal subunit interface protein
MKASDMRITFDGLETSEALKNYTIEKLEKHQNFLENAISGEAILVEEISKKGISNDFKISMNISLPGKEIHVEELGEDMYVIIDRVVNTLMRILRKRHEKNLKRGR